ncbi:metalloregulator ArsR/SmtB family transcription factor [Desulfurispirillum indicum]|uniref:ArsR/SmtB family transcription factor n=1 Tax=Desulfurispirillum indicum TaxID=936456 RepID=UPI001CFAA4DA|nr:metalloregulator ArsR/SmtB family transcription factor [Desulfurispirillum indicum]UCZ57027.1 metalloregulator ArsR/SmtB family transcription factor [Desulfurispirillum indicum]
MEQTLDTLKALSDASRMRVILALCSHDELCACQLIEMLDLAAATVSRHMTILQEARLVRSRREGRWVYYFLSESFPSPLYQWLSENMQNSPSVANDRQRLTRILQCSPAELFRAQEERRRCCD